MTTQHRDEFNLPVRSESFPKEESFSAGAHTRDVLPDLTTEYDVLNAGFVRLDDHMAEDLSVVNSARVSFGTRVEGISVKDEGLINFLMRERHGTPFEHNAMRFHIKAPISVFREWQRHRIGSFNELSARYKEFTDPDFYIPAEEHVRTQVGKPGAYSFDPVDPAVALFTQAQLASVYSYSFVTYQTLIEQGVAKELARQVLPVGLYSEMYWTVNARSLMNFISLRAATTAMLEIRLYAQVIEEIFSSLMPITHRAFVANGRTAP